MLSRESYKLQKISTVVDSIGSVLNTSSYKLQKISTVVDSFGKWAYDLSYKLQKISTVVDSVRDYINRPVAISFKKFLLL